MIKDVGYVELGTHYNTLPCIITSTGILSLSKDFCELSFDRLRMPELNPKPIYKRFIHTACSVVFIAAGSLVALQVNASTLFSKDAPPLFGKTHFIVGFDHTEYALRPSSKNTQGAGTPIRTHVFFSPDDNVQQKLIDLIGQEWVSIKVAVFTFTDREIAQALVNAHKRGVDVQIVVDPCQMKERYSKVSHLQKNGIPVFEYNPDYINDKRSNLMHHKFVIFGAARECDGCVWTGSFNFTKAANKRNQENAVLVYDGATVAQFLAQYAKLKKRCVGCRR